MRDGHHAWVRAYFRNFAEFQAPQTGSPLYGHLSRGVLDDPGMLALAARCPRGQPPANLLFGAVHYLLLRDAADAGAHALARWYPDVLEAPHAASAPDDDTYPAFRAFVAAHRGAIEALLRTRAVQTNVVRRTTVLLPGFACVAAEAGDRELALLEVGASAGLNLHWDRYRHVFEGDEALARWGPEDAELALSTRVHGALPPLPDPRPRIAWRGGVDLQPIDVRDPDALLWLRALIFPEHVERHAELEKAAAVARRDPVPVVRGDASVVLPDLLASLPRDAEACLYATMVLYQLDAAARARFEAHLHDASLQRPVSLLSLDGRADGVAELTWHRFRRGRRKVRRLAECQPHGRWLRWLAEDGVG